MIYDEAYYLKRDIMIIRGALQKAVRGEVSYEEAILAALPVTEAAAQGGYPEHRGTKIGEGEICPSRWSRYQCMIPLGHTGDHISAKAFWDDEHEDKINTVIRNPADHAHEHWLVPLNACEPYAKSCATCNETFEADELVVFVNESDKVITALVGGHCKSVLPGDTLTVPASSLPGGFIPAGLVRATALKARKT